MSCPHGNPIGNCDTCDEVDAAFEAGKRSALAEQQEPVAVWELFEGGWDSIADPEWMETLPVGTKLYTFPQPAQQQQEPVACERCLELERLCDATYVAQGADAYNHACDEMERWQQTRQKAGKEVGTTGSLCDGISWLYGHIDELEAKVATQQPQAQPQQGPVAGLHAVYFRNNWDGEGDLEYVLAHLSEKGEWTLHENGAPLIEFKGDEIIKTWPLTFEIAAPQAQRKPLTDEQIFELAREHQDWDRNLIRVRSFARAIEAAHEIKDQP